MRSVLILLAIAACDVGSVETGGSGTGGPDAGGGSGGSNVDAAGSGAAATGLSVSFTTTPKGGTYAPKNIVAVWIEDSGGAFVKTIGRWADVRKGSLVGWNAKSGGDADAVSGATRNSHTAPLTVTWDLKSKAAAIVPDGTYTLRMELADSNATAVGQNNEGTFTFIKGTSPQSQTALSNGGFTGVSIDFTP